MIASDETRATNTYNQYLAMPNLGTPIIAATTDMNFTSVQQTSFTPTLVSAPPRIVRLYGHGRVEAPNGLEGSRATIVVDVERIADSCGYGVPLMAYESERPQRLAWLAKKQRDGLLEAYVAEQNAVSIDGLPGLGGD